MRMSIKLLDAEPADLQPGIRRELEAVLGGPGEVAHMQAAVRSGCLHIVADAVVTAVCSWPWRSYSPSSFWRRCCLRAACTVEAFFAVSRFRTPRCICTCMIVP